MNVLAVNFSVSVSGDWEPIVEMLLQGARSGGAATEKYFASEGGSSPVSGDGQPWETVSDSEGVASLIARAKEADHVILSVSGDMAFENSIFTKFVDACYEGTEWMSLADAFPPDGAGTQEAMLEGLETIRFPVDRSRNASGRALTVVGPPYDIGESTDPFCENRFFILEETARVLGFTPAGRILCTGLFFPPVGENPVLEAQALELGRSLVNAAAVSREKHDRKPR